MEKSPQPGSHFFKPTRSQKEACDTLRALSNSPHLRTLETALLPAKLYLVGGTVRDAFYETTDTDLDLATDLTAEQIRDRCAAKGLKVVDTGIQHGTVLIVIDSIHIEVTTFRHPADRNTQITAHDIETDLSGRDFTINALAYSLETMSLLDPWNGANDLKDGVIRAVGSPSARFAEDPLRVLRMIRFGDAQGRVVEEQTLKAARDSVSLLSTLSVERVRTEVERILMSSYPSRGVRALHTIGALPFTLPELIPAVGFEQNKYHIHDVFEHTLSVLDRTPRDRILRWAAIFHDIGKPHTLSVGSDGERHFYSHEVVSDTLCKERMTHLRFSHEDINTVRAIVRHHMRPMDCGPAGVRRLIRDLGPHMKRWRTFKEADSSPTIPVEQFQASARGFDDMLAAEQAKMALPSYGRLALTGDDLRNEGIAPGPGMGKILKELAEIVIEDPSKNDRETLLNIVRARVGADVPTGESSSADKKS
jgi:tRNA nucleotidyltransferase (CCA-adding enzyme)